MRVREHDPADLAEALQCPERDLPGDGAGEADVPRAAKLLRLDGGSDRIHALRSNRAAISVDEGRRATGDDRRFARDLVRIPEVVADLRDDLVRLTERSEDGRSVRRRSAEDLLDGCVAHQRVVAIVSDDDRHGALVAPRSVACNRFPSSR